MGDRLCDISNIMAKEEILENLGKALRNSTEKERVVFIMVEMRKFIESSESVAPYWENLKYWCDWVVHTRLDKRFAKEALNRMEEYIVSNPGSKFHHSDFNLQFISLQSFRRNFYQFLKFYGLPAPAWGDFSKYLVESLRDCPLKKRKRGWCANSSFLNENIFKSIKNTLLIGNLYLTAVDPIYTAAYLLVQRVVRTNNGGRLPLLA